MKHLFTLFLCTSVLFLSSIAQNTDEKPEFSSPYKTSFKTDAPIIAGGIGLTYLGTRLIADKKDLTIADLATKTRKSVPFFDRGNVGYNSEKADKDSYIPFHASFAWPVVMMLANGNERKKVGQIAVLYVETMAITGTLFTMSAGAVHRSRPLVYEGTTASTDERRKAKNQRSFFAGHTAATAAASFFTAKVFQDFNPDSKAKVYVWVLAAALPAVTGYLRYKGGMHFLSDNLLGYALGAGAGILVPQLHKTKMMRNVSIVPEAGKDYKGMAIVYRF